MAHSDWTSLPHFAVWHPIGSFFEGSSGAALCVTDAGRPHAYFFVPPSSFHRDVSLGYSALIGSYESGKLLLANPVHDKKLAIEATLKSLDDKILSNFS